MLRIGVFWMCIGIIGIGNAQELPMKIKGQVKSAIQNTGISGATIRVLRKIDELPIQEMETTSDGTFSFELPKATYLLKVTKDNFQTVVISSAHLTGTGAGIIYLMESSSTLEDVLIRQEKSAYTGAIDKKTYVVDKDVIALGGTAQDVLENVPSVAVDSDGTIALRGNPNVTLLLDGKPSGLTGITPDEALQQLTAVSISRIEVITTPSARYDAEGNAGIINIVLLKSRKKGTQGTVTLSSYWPKYGGGTLSLNHQVGRVNLFTTTGYQDREIPGNALNITEYTIADLSFSRREERQFDRRRRRWNTTTGISWDVTPKAMVTTSISYRSVTQDHRTTNQIYDANTVANTRLTLEDGTQQVLQYALGYLQKFSQPDQQLSIDVQSERFRRSRRSVITETQTDGEEHVWRRTEQKLQLLQADYSHPFPSLGTFESGYRGSFKDVEIANTVQANTSAIVNDSERLKYKEDVNAVYTQWQTQVKQFSLVFGLRLEQTRIGISQQENRLFIPKRYTDLFPSATLKQKLTEHVTLALGYSRRIQRPRLRWLNPFPSRTSATVLFQGNPDLDPSYTHTLECSYQHKFAKVTWESAAYYAHTQQPYTFIADRTGTTLDGVPIFTRQPINLDKTQRYGIETTANIKSGSRIEYLVDANIFQQTTQGRSSTGSLDARFISWLARAQAKVKCTATITAQMTLNYKGPTEDGQTFRKGIFNSSLGLSASVLKSKGTISLAIQDVLNTRIRRLRDRRTNFTSDLDFQYRERRAVLSLTYRLQQKKANKKKRPPILRSDDPDW